MDTSNKPSVVARDAAIAALHAAKEQAAKPGPHTSEFWFSLVGGALTAAAAAATTVLAGPVAGAIVAASLGSAIVTYNQSRGSVKAAIGEAAITALGDIAKDAPGTPVGDAAVIASTVVGAVTGGTK